MRLDNYSHEAGFSYLGLDGKPVKRTPWTDPYSYDEFVLHKSKDFNEITTYWVYSDRLMEWNYERFESACEAVWHNRGQLFYNRTPKDINKFLNLYFGKEVGLTAVVQGCNGSNGCPYWIFGYEAYYDDPEEEQFMSL